MCGVCGIVPLGPLHVSARAQSRVAGMMKALAHRGPDDSGLASSDTAVLGATRLAIRGLASGKQPIIHSESGVVAVCNGEIDNHRELRQWLLERGRTIKSETDVAVIPELYLELGEKFVERLQGVFAIALWDPQRMRLLLARDRAGERPLFFQIGASVVRFATEVAALASDDQGELTISSAAISEYLQHGCLVAPRSPFSEIQKVAPGEIISITIDEIRRRRYWRWNISNETKKKPEPDRFDEIFRDAVRRQTDIDVPFGVFLSGGLDSSLVAAVARSLRPDAQLNAYSLRFTESSFDEGTFAEEVAEKLGLNPVSVWVDAEAFPTTVRELLTRGGEPLADPAWIPTALLAQRAAKDVKLALAGEGGDEVFGGYPTYLAAKVGASYARLPAWCKNAFRKVVDHLPESDRKMTVPFLLKKFVAGTEADGVARHLFWKANASTATLARLGVESHLLNVADIKRDSLLDALQQIDLETTLAEGLLTKADRAGMASALEIRTPFLDQHVMEFAATLPENERVRGITTKYFLKEYALKYLPKRIVHRRKRGLSVPLKQWLRGPLYQWAQELLASDLLSRAGIEKRAALDLLEEHCAGRADHARLIWALLVLAEWLRWEQQR
jgi:asparagine synthase (glutamine-hydrolysing)